MTFMEMHVKWSVTSRERLDPEILTVLEVRGHVFHRVFTVQDSWLVVRLKCAPN